MEVIVQKDAASASVLAARLVAQAIRENPRTVLGLATGSTPLALYNELVRLHREEDLSFRYVTTFNLDEYIGLAHDHPMSYHHFMWDNFFKHLDIDPKRVNIPDGLAKDVPKFCVKYEQMIKRAGGIDIQILGVGTDGHIGFNEPTSSLASRTRIKTLTPQTRQDNARFFKSIKDVPNHCITMGIGTILESHMSVLLAFGKNKAVAVQQMVEGPVSALWPATALQHHPNIKVFLDKPASGKLKHTKYYDWVFKGKPGWQQF